MRKYFEYPFNETVREDLLEYYQQYETESKGMHTGNHMDKIKLKIKRMQKHVTVEPTDTILDVGCSEGGFIYEMANHCKLGIGMDISEPLIAKLSVNCPTEGTIRFESFDGVNIGYENTFDKVFMFDVLEHAFDPDALTESVWKCLKPSGLLVIQVPTTGWLSESIFGKYHMGHLRYYDDKYLCNYLEQFGFDVKAVDVYNSVPFSSKFIKYPLLYRMLDFSCSIMPSTLFPYFGSVMAVAQRKERG